MIYKIDITGKFHQIKSFKCMNENEVLNCGKHCWNLQLKIIFFFTILVGSPFFFSVHRIGSSMGNDLRSAVKLL